MWARCLLGAALALGAWARPVGAGPLPSLEITQATLSNGLHVILHRDPTLPRVHTHLLYRVGSACERPGRTGLAHLFEHLMFEGSAHVPEGEFDLLLESVGGDNNATTSEDHTCYFTSVPSSAVELPLFLESDRLGFLLPAMTPGRVDSQRDVVKNELRQSYLDPPYEAAWLEIPRLLYPAGHPYSWPVIGSMEDLSAADQADVEAFFRTWYVPSNASLAVVGDIDPAALLPMIERWFGGIPGGAPGPRPQVPEVRLEGVARHTFQDQVELPQRWLIWPTPALLAPGDAELDLLASILAGGRSGRLQRRLVYERQLVQEISAFQLSRELGSMFVIQFTPQPGHTLEEVQAAVDEELRRAQTEACPPQALARVRNQVEAAFLAALEQAGEKASRLNTYHALTGDPDHFEEDLDRYRRATPESVRRVAERALPLDRRLEVSVVPEGVGP